VPKRCKAGVIVNEGPDFHMEIVEVDVPEPGMLSRSHGLPSGRRLTEG
jgi:hypothetical protein